MVTGFGVRLANYEYTGTADITSTPADIVWNAASDEDAGYFSCDYGTGDADIVLNEIGHYLAWWWTRSEHDVADTNGRREVTGRLQLGGTDLKPSWLAYYSRANGSGTDEGCCLGACVFETTAADTVLQAWVQRTDDLSPAGDPKFVSDRTGIALLKLDDGWSYGRFHTTTAASSPSTTAWSNLSWNTTPLEEDSAVIEQQSDAWMLRLKEQGHYLVTVTVPVHSTSASQRYCPGIRVLVDSAQVGPEYCRTMRSTDSCQDTTLTFFRIISTTGTNKDLQVQYRERIVASPPPGISWAPTDECSIEIVRIPDDADFAMLRDLGGDQRVDGNLDVQWDTQDELDTGSFSHSTSTNPHYVEIEKAGRYMQLAQMFCDRTSGTSPTRLINHFLVRKYSTPTDIKRGQSITYNRGTSGTQDFGRASANVALSIASGTVGSQVGIRHYELSALTDTAAVLVSNVSMQLVSLSELLPVIAAGRTLAVTSDQCALVRDVAIKGQAVGSSYGQCILTVDRAITGQTVGETTAQAAVAVDRGVAGQTMARADGQGAVAVDRALSGQSLGASLTQAALAIDRAISGQTLGASPQEATPLALDVGIVGRALGSAVDVGAALAIDRALAGRTLGVTVDQAVLDVDVLSEVLISGQTLGSSHGQCALSIDRAVAGRTLGAAVDQAAIAVDRAVLGRALGVATSQASIGVDRAIVGRALGATVDQAILTVDAASVVLISGRTLGSAHGQCALSIDRGITGRTLGASYGLAAIAVDRGMAGQTLGHALTRASLAVDRAILGRTLGEMVSQGVLTLTTPGFYESTSQKVRARLIAQVQTPQGWTVQHENMPFSKPVGAYVRAAVVFDETEHLATGVATTIQATGFLQLAIHVPLNRGQEAAKQMADTAAAVFREAQDDGVSYQIPTIERQGRQGRRWVLHLVCPFNAYTSSTRIATSGTAATDFESIADAIRQRFRTEIETGQSVAVQYENMPFTKPTGQPTPPHIALWIPEDEAFTVMRGRSRLPGVFIAQIFVPLDRGIQAALVLADSIDEAFRVANISGVEFEPPTVARGKRSGNFWQKNVNCRWLAELRT